MLRKGNWKCIYYHGEKPELYNLEADPKEIVDHSHDPECGPVLDKMLAEILWDWDPEELQADMDRIVERRSLVYGLPADTGSLQGEYWKGPADYGWVEPTS